MLLHMWLGFLREWLLVSLLRFSMTGALLLLVEGMLDNRGPGLQGYPMQKAILVRRWFTLVRFKP